MWRRVSDKHSGTMEAGPICGFMRDVPGKYHFTFYNSQPTAYTNRQNQRQDNSTKFPWSPLWINARLAQELAALLPRSSLRCIVDGAIALYNCW